MSRESLQVNTAHLRDLAARHEHAAAELAWATDEVSAVDRGIRTSHGVIASSTANAVRAVQHARRQAGYSVVAESHTLSGHLTAAAGRYETVDHSAGARLDAQLRPEPIAQVPHPPR